MKQWIKNTPHKRICAWCAQACIGRYIGTMYTHRSVSCANRKRSNYNQTAISREEKKHADTKRVSSRQKKCYRKWKKARTRCTK